MSISTRSDTIKILLHTLQEHPAVQKAVGGRVYGAHIKDSDVISTLSKGPIIIVSMQSGRAIYSGAVHNNAFEVWGYSLKSGAEAAEAYDAAFEALQACRVSCPGIDLCGNAREVQGYLVGENGKYNAWYARGRWIITAA